MFVSLKHKVLRFYGMKLSYKEGVIVNAEIEIKVFLGHKEQVA